MNKDMEEMVRARAIHEMKCKDVDKGNEREETGFKVGRLDRQTDRQILNGWCDGLGRKVEMKELGEMEKKGRT